MKRLKQVSDRTQALRIEALRFALLAVRVSFHRVVEATMRIERQPGNIAFSDVFALLLDCWSVIDSVDRTRELVLHIRGLKRTSPELQLLLRRTASVADVRNLLQHIATEIPTLSHQIPPTMGSFSWVQSDDPSSSFTIWLGVSEHEFTVPSLAIDTWHDVFARDAVLKVAENEVSLTELNSATSDFALFLDGFLDRGGFLSDVDVVPSRMQFMLAKPSDT